VILVPKLDSAGSFDPRAVSGMALSLSLFVTPTQHQHPVQEYLEMGNKLALSHIL